MNLNLGFSQFPHFESHRHKLQGAAYDRLLAVFRAALCLFVLLFPLGAKAQVVDQIDVQRPVDGEREIVLRFFQDVALLRYSPEKEGKQIRIYFRMLSDQTPIVALAQERLSGPSGNGLPRFSLRFPEADSALVLNFDSSVAFRVRQIRGTRTISVIVQTNETQGDAAGQGIEPRTVTASSLDEAARKGDVAAGKIIPQGAATPDGAKVYEPRVVPGIPDEVIPVKKAAPAAVASAKKSPTSNQPAGAPKQTPDDAKRLAAALAASKDGNKLATAQSASDAVIDPATFDEDAPVSLTLLEPSAKILLDRAKNSLAANDVPKAIKYLNNVLNLPNNASTREAQELIGLAREKNNELAKANSEYELFVKLYPQGADTDRVKLRNAQLQSKLHDEAEKEPLRDSEGNAVKPQWIITGSLSQNYYSGNSHIEILTPPPPGMLTFNQQTLSMQDQHALVTNLDLMARRRDGSTDSKIVVRESYTFDFLNRNRDLNRLSAIYFEQQDQKLGYQYRVGRQSGTFGAVGMYDGAFGAYQIAPEYRVSALGGEIAQYVTTPIKRYVYGAGLEKSAKPEQIGGTLYFMQQTADSYVDRRAIGLELRYFDTNASVFSNIDYDILFNRLNMVMAQANYRFDNGANIYVLGDLRRSPMLQLSSSLPAATGPAPNFAPAQNIAQALLNTGMSVTELRKWADDISATSHMMSAGVTYPITLKWQVGMDLGLAGISSTTGAGSVPAQPSSGDSKTVNLQLIGNGLLLESDSGVANTTMIEAPTYSGYNMGLNYGASFIDNKLRSDFGLRWYKQSNKNDSGKMDRTSPTLRMSYRLFDDVSLEAEGGYEKSTQVDAGGSSTKSNRVYFYLGYRWSFY